MKILFFTRLYHPHIGGVEKHVREISKRLKKKGHKVTVLTTKFDRKLTSEETIDRIKVYRFYQPKIKFFGLIYTWFWLFKNINLIKKTDLIHIHDVFIWYLPFKLFFPNKPVFTTIHGPWGTYPIQVKDKIQKKIASRLSIANICIGDYIPKNYGIKADLISYGATDIPKKHPKKDKNLIIYVGRLDKELTLKKYFKVFDQIKGFNIEFCGDGELMGKCMEYGKVHGFCDPTPFYKKAKFCFASGYLTILEALANKCLVITSYSNPLHQDYYQLAPFSKFIICSSDPKKLYKQFVYYSENDFEAQKLINKGYRWVKRQTWVKLVNQYLKLWKIK